jgi:cellobiose transport system permease protein
VTATETRATTSPDSPPPNTERTPRRIMSFSNKVSRWDLKLSPYLYISPFFLLFALVGLFPIAYTAVISFQEWDLVRNTGEFVGFDQYIWILGQEQFWVALRNTFSIFLLSSVPQIILALFIAAMLDRNIRAKTFWRMSVLLPFVMAPVAVTLIFSNMFGDNHGLVNNILTNIGLQPIPWHVSPFWSHIAIATMVNFRWTGYNALILLAAMQAVPREYYEAATVDGANAFRHHASLAAAYLHLRHHHLDHRWPADLR